MNSLTLCGKVDILSFPAVYDNLHLFELHSTRYPLLLKKQTQFQMGSLPHTSTCDWHWESNPDS